MSPSDTQNKLDEREELREILGAFSDDGLVVDEVLKDSGWERTELVHRIGEDAAPGGAQSETLVRKTIKLAEGQASAYETVFSSQEQGRGPVHVPRILDCRRLGDDLAVLMERAPGETLETIVAREGGSEELARLVFPEICAAVQELHDIAGGPVIHRDIKPSNVVIDLGGVGSDFDDARAFLIDLGIARTYRADAPVDTQRFGTPGYAPPEQFGYGQTGVASDVYALGMLLYFCLTGEEPSASLREGDAPFATAPERYRQVLAKATEFDPKARFASVGELREAFLVAPNELESSPSAHPVEKQSRFRAAGIVWDVILAGAFVITVITTCNAIWNAPGAISDVPFVTRLITYLLISPVLCGALAYALADRRPFRQYLPASRKLTLLQETLICVAIIVGSLIAIALVWTIGTAT